MDITELTENELKALAYDEMVKMEMAKQNLSIITKQLQELNQEDEEKKQLLARESKP